MRNAAMVREVDLGPYEADDEIEIGRGRSQESGGDAPRQSAGRSLARRRSAG